MNRIIRYFKRVFGIDLLENKTAEQERRIKKLEFQFKEEYDQVSRILKGVMEDNRVILRHVNFLNSQFLVASDICNSKYDPSVVIIMHRGKQEIVKTYTFLNETVEEIYRILEGFGRENNSIDKPRSFPGPRFRY